MLGLGDMVGRRVGVQVESLRFRGSEAALILDIPTDPHSDGEMTLGFRWTFIHESFPDALCDLPRPGSGIADQCVDLPRTDVGQDPYGAPSLDRCLHLRASAAEGLIE
jgi:hypothetical protein